LLPTFAYSIPGTYQQQQSAAGFPITAIRSDKGGEYLGGALQTWLKEQGISGEPTVGYSPESNGVAERMNRTLESKVRSMMKDAPLPKYLWEILAATAAYLHNRSPSRPLGGKSPFEKVNSIKPDLPHLRIIGSKAFVYNSERETKRQPD
jgi:transposase InsO family protein